MAGEASVIDRNKIATGLPPAADASSEDKGTYAVVRFAAQNDHFVGLYKTWTKALNFLVGEHWRTRWDGTSLTWNLERDIPAWHQQPVTNLVFAVYRSALAKLTKQKPTLEVVPPSGDSEDKEAAELSEALLVYLWRYLKKPQKVPLLIGWLLITGKSYVRVGWDPLGGEIKPRTIPVQRRRQPLGGQPTDATSEEAQPDDLDAEDTDVAADENGDPYRTEAGAIDFARAPDQEPMGEISWTIVSPLCVRLNPEATSNDDATEMYVATLWPKNKCAKHFGIDESEISDFGESTEQRSMYEDLMSATAAGFPRSWMDQQSVWGVSQEDAIGDRVLVVEYYANKDADFPKGRHWISAGIKKVWPPEDKKQAAAAEHIGDGESDFEKGEASLPFGFWPPLVPCFDTPIPGQPEALGVIPQIVPLNEQLNVMDGKIAEHHVMNAMGGIWFVGPLDASIQITSEPGQVIVSKEMGRRGSAFAPFQAQMHPLPEPVYRERDTITQKIVQVSNLTSIDLQQKPTGTPSGRALLVNQETSDSVLMPTLLSLEACLEECGRRELIIAQEKYTEERTIAIKGDDGEWLYRSFTNADLRAGHDVRVQVGSSFPWSKSAQWDTRLSLLEAMPQLVVRPDGTVDTQKLAKYLDAGTPGLGAFESDEDPDLMETQREHAQFEAYNPAEGALQLPQIAPWQDHTVHLHEHYTFMKRDYARFQKWHPDAQNAFKQHMQVTMIAVEDLADRTLGAPPMAGAPPAPGAGPGGEAPGAAAPPGGGSPLALVPPGQPAPPRGGPQARLNSADFADARAVSGA